MVVVATDGVVGVGLVLVLVVRALLIGILPVVGWWLTLGRCCCGSSTFVWWYDEDAFRRSGCCCCCVMVDGATLIAVVVPLATPPAVADNDFFFVLKYGFTITIVRPDVFVWSAVLQIWYQQSHVVVVYANESQELATRYTHGKP